MYSVFVRGNNVSKENVDTRLCDDSLWNDFKLRYEREDSTNKELLDMSGNYLQGPGYSVIDKGTVSLGNNIHDYVSLSSYDWPNPETPNGLPWIHRDGVLNPETENYDAPRLVNFCRAVGTLVTASKLTGEQKYARRAGVLLKRWFIDPETRMNPHLHYAQFVPGVDAGSSWGLIDAQFFCHLNESVRSLEFNPDWTETDRKAYDAWMTQYFFWLISSPLAVKEEGSPTNHGTWYDVQFVSIALLLRHNDLARRQIVEKTIPRLSVQLLQDGRQPFELSRTLSLSYSMFNLTAWVWLSSYARKLGIELWTCPSDDNATLKKAFDFIFPYLRGDKEWIYTQIGNVSGEGARLIAMVSRITEDSDLKQYLSKDSKTPFFILIPNMITPKKQENI